MILKALREWGRAELVAARVDSPRLDADLLLAEALEFSKIDLITRSDQDVAPQQEARFRLLIERRKCSEPVAYILGRKDFYEHQFLVSPAVLIPRPETELVVERALAILAERLPKERVALIDVGTGSGAIALSILAAAMPCFSEAELSGLTAFALDISVDALAVARENARRLGLSDTLQLVRSDLLAGLDTAPFRDQFRGAFGLVCANLPYIPEDEKLPPSVEKFEPSLALRAGSRGMALIDRLLQQLIREKLFEKGRLVMELGRGQDLEVNSRLFTLGRPAAVFHPDLQGILRVAEIPI